MLIEQYFKINFILYTVRIQTVRKQDWDQPQPYAQGRICALRYELMLRTN